MCFPRSETEDKHCKEDVIILGHGTICSNFFVKFGAALWVAAVTNGGSCVAGSKSIRVEDTPLMKIEVFVEDMVAKESRG